MVPTAFALCLVVVRFDFGDKFQRALSLQNSHAVGKVSLKIYMPLGCCLLTNSVNSIYDVNHNIKLNGLTLIWINWINFVLTLTYLNFNLNNNNFNFGLNRALWTYFEQF